MCRPVLLTVLNVLTLAYCLAHCTVCPLNVTTKYIYSYMQIHGNHGSDQTPCFLFLIAVSVVAARNSSNRSTAIKAGKAAAASMQDKVCSPSICLFTFYQHFVYFFPKVLLASPGKAVVSAEDSGRGESPESCSSSTGVKG